MFKRSSLFLALFQILHMLTFLFTCYIKYWEGMLKFPTEIVDLSVFFFNSVNFCFMNFQAHLLDAYLFRIFMPSWCVTLLLSELSSFALCFKVYFVINIALFTLFLLFAWYILSHPFTFNLFGLIFKIYKARFCF